MSFRRSIVRLAHHQKGEHTNKWWSKYTPVEGRVTQHLSPFEVNVTRSLSKTLPGNFSKGLIKWLTSAWFGVIFLVGTYNWGIWKHKQIALSHRA
mmetsp:Transcript_15762/g.16509  ORF Transcript_15762/g.16509 Transcript_15762/m.16509 type:complete len:95 (+) Transcript_15762:47-331(+)